MNRFDKLFETFEGADCVLITSDINRRYFTGMKSSAGVVIAFPGKAYLLIDFRYIEKARAVVTDAEVIEAKKLYPQLMELLNKHDAKSIAIESETMTVLVWNRRNRPYECPQGRKCHFYAGIPYCFFLPCVSLVSL